MKWNTNNIVEDLAKITTKKIETEQHPEGGYYCRDITIKTTSVDGIQIVGFNLGDISDVDNPTQDIEYVEIRNYQSDSNGGLSKDASKKTREVYFQVVDYFRKRKIQIADNLKDYF